MEKYKQKPVTQNESGSGYCVLERVVVAAQEVLTSVDELIANSQGVYGLHLNGDLAPWSDLLAGGRFGEWLEPLEKLRAALDRLLGKDVTRISGSKQ